MAYKNIINELQILINEAKNMPEPKKSEMLKLINNLKTELEKKPEDKNSAKLTESKNDLETMVEEFEISHPVLTENMASLLNLLSNLGI